jgi:hypothetical protein
MPLRPPAGFISANYDPLKNPDAPTIGTATEGDSSASVAFTAPANVGGSAISAYYAVSNPGQFTATAASSPITVTGLTNGTAYTFRVWALNTYGPGPYSATSNSVTPAIPPYGLFSTSGSGGTASENTIERIIITTTGNATDFGDLSQSRSQGAACGSSTRGVFGGGFRGGGINLPSNVIDYVTFATAGNAIDFGDLLTTVAGPGGCSSATRGLFAGGNNFGTPTNAINYITIATTGNAIDFGDLLATSYDLGSCASTTRGVFAGGTSGNVIQYVTIATTGNSTDFGDLLSAPFGMRGCSSPTRGIFGGGSVGVVLTNAISYITIATTGNATDFGDLTVAREYLGACSSTVRGVFGGGGTPGYSNIIDYVTIASIGNATDFGDLTVTMEFNAGCSSAHGGI